MRMPCGKAAVTGWTCCEGTLPVLMSQLHATSKACLDLSHFVQLLEVSKLVVYMR